MSMPEESHDVPPARNPEPSHERRYLWMAVGAVVIAVAGFTGGAVTATVIDTAVGFVTAVVHHRGGELTPPRWRDRLPGDNGLPGRRTAPRQDGAAAD